MKYFVVEGTITNADLMNDNIMKEHMAYSQKAMDEGLILMSGLKEDMSGGLFVMKAESPKTLEIYLNNGGKMRLLKRIFDIVFSLIVLILLSPIFLIVALLVRIKLGSPILFTQ